MKKVEFKEDDVYGWKPEDIHMNAKMAAHMKHHLNNYLTVAQFVAQQLLKERPNDKSLAILQTSLDCMIDYVEQTGKRIKE